MRDRTRLNYRSLMLISIDNPGRLSFRALRTTGMSHGTSRPHRLILILLLLVSLTGFFQSSRAFAAMKFWDTNGFLSGAGGATPAGTWNTGGVANWATNTWGIGFTTTWAAGDDAVFSAGTGATGIFIVTVSGTNSVHNITVEEGTPTLTGGTLTLVTSDATWDGGLGLMVNSAINFNTFKLKTNGIVNLGGNLTISDKLEVQAGTTTVTGTNSGSGGVKLDGAGTGRTLVIGSDTALGTGGTFEWGEGFLSTTGGSRTISSGIAVDWKNKPITFAGSDNLTFNGVVTIANNNNISVTGTGRLTFAGGLVGNREPTKLGTGTWVLGGTTTSDKNFKVNQGTLLVNGVHSGGDNYTVTPTVAGSAATLGGIGTIGPMKAAGKNLTLTGATISTIATRAILNPGDGTNYNPLTVGTSGVNMNATFGNLSRLAIDIDGANADRLTILGNLTLSSSTTDDLVFNVLNTPTAGKYTILSYTGTRTDSGSTGFTTATGIPTGYRLSYSNFLSSNGTIDLIQGAVILPTATPTNASIITGGTTPITVSVKNNAQTGGDTLNQFRVSAGTNVTGSSVNGGPLAPQASSGSVGSFTFNGTAVGVTAGSVSVSSTDSGVTTPVAGNFNVNVYGHASGSVGGTTLTIPDVILGYGSAVASSNSINVSNASGFRVNLKTTNNGPLNSLSLNNVGGVGAGASGSLTGSLATGKGIGSYSQGLTLTFADDSVLSGASSSLGTQAITVNGNVFDHASGSVGGTTLTIPDVILGYGSAVASSNSINVSNASGFRVNLKTTNNGPLNSLSLNNVGGVGAGASGSLTGSLATGKGVGSYSQGLTLTYADDSASSGASSSLGTQAITVSGNVLNHASPSLSTASITFGNLLVGYAATPVGVNLQNAAGPNRADLVLTAVNGSGNTGTLTRSGASTGSVAAGGSLANSIGLATTASGSFAASYAYDVEDQNLLGGTDLTTQNLSASATVYDPASLTANTASTLDSGNNVSIANASGTFRSAAFVDAISISTGWTLNNLSVGNAIASGAGTPTATVTHNDVGLLNNYVVTGTLGITLENDQTILGSGNQDLGTFNWNLSHTVRGQSGSQSAHVPANGAYDGLSGTSDKLLGSVARLLDGDNSNGPATTVMTTWRSRTGTELPSNSSSPLASDVVDLMGSAGDVFVMELTYDQGQVSTEANSALSGALHLAWLDGGVWKRAIEGNTGTNTTIPAFLNYQGSWAASEAGLILGAWGIDTVNKVAWAVLDHSGEFAVVAEAVVPEPSTFLLGVLGIGMLALSAWRCRRNSGLMPCAAR